MTFLIVLALIAQTFNPLAPQMAYTIARWNHSNPDPSQMRYMLLATLSGRYAVRLGPACPDTIANHNITIHPYLNIPPWLAISLPGGNPNLCSVLIFGRLFDAPCARNDAHECDIDLEFLA